MQSLVASGRIVDLILLFMLVEAAALLVYRRLTGRGLKPLNLALTLLPGLFLLLALRAGLTGDAWTAVLAWLGAALLAHLADLLRRMQVSSSS
jgi:hypothetical protein